MAEQQGPTWQEVVSTFQEIPDYKTAPPQLRARVLRLLARKVVRSGRFGGSPEAARTFTRDVVVPEAYRREGQDRANAQALDRAQEVDVPFLPDVRVRRGFEAAAQALDRAGLSLSNERGQEFVDAQQNTPTGLVGRRLTGERIDLPAPRDAIGALAAQGRDALSAGREIAGDLAAGRVSGMGAGLGSAAATTAGSLADPLGMALGIGAGRIVGQAAGRVAADVGRLGGQVGARAAGRVQTLAPVAGAGAGGAAVGAVPPLVAGRAPTGGEVGAGALMGLGGAAPGRPAPRPRQAPPTAATAPIRARVLPRTEAGGFSAQQNSTPRQLSSGETSLARQGDAGGIAPDDLFWVDAVYDQQLPPGRPPRQLPGEQPRPLLPGPPSGLPELPPGGGLGGGPVGFQLARQPSPALLAALEQARRSQADAQPPARPALQPDAQSPLTVESQPVPTIATPVAAGEAARIVAQRAGDPPIRSAMVDLPSLELDPVTFQFKEGGDGQGVTQRLRGVEAWDPGAAAANRVIVFERADGRQVVADGHQRTGLARRLREQGQEVPPAEALVLRESDGWTPPKALAFAARNNLQQGTGGPLDVARLLRAGTLTENDRAAMPRLGQGGAAWRDGEALSAMPDGAFDLVAAGVVEPEHAAAVARHIQGEAQQVAALRQMSRRPPASAAEAENTARVMNALGFSQRVEQTLFGPELKADPMIDHAGPIITEAMRHLRGDKAFFNRLVEGKAKAQGVKGNRVNEQRTAKAAQDAADVAALADLVMMAPGVVRQRLRALASQMEAGTTNRAKAGQALAEAVGEQVATLRAKGYDRAKAVRLFAERGELPPELQAPIAPELLEVAETVGPELDAMANRLRDDLGPDALADLADHLEREGMAAIADGQGRLFSGVDPSMLRGAVQVSASVILRGVSSGAQALAALAGRFGPLAKRALTVGALALRRLLADEGGFFDSRRLNDFIEAALDRVGELIDDGAAIGAEAIRRASSPFARGSVADARLGQLRQAQQRGEAVMARMFGTIFGNLADFAEQRTGYRVHPEALRQAVLAARAFWKTHRPDEAAAVAAGERYRIPAPLTRAGLGALEAVRHAFISNYGVPPSVIEAAMQAENWARGRANFVRRVADDLTQLPMDQREALGLEVTEGTPGQRSPEAERIANIAGEVSRELRRLDVLTPQQVEKWAGRYLPRVYQKNLAPAVSELIVGAAKSLVGSKARGFTNKMSVRAFNEAQRNGELWEFRGYVGKYGTKAAVQEAKVAKLREALDKALADGSVAKAAKLQERFEAEATKLADLWDDPALEVKAWRDYTLEERADMGELQDVALRLKVLADKSERNFRNGRLLQDIAQLGDDEGPFVYPLDEDGALMEPPDPEGWMLMETTKADGAKKWGQLSGRYVRADVARYLKWRMEMLPFIQKVKTLTLMNRFKKNKTLWNPAYFLNNAMMNVPTLELAGGSVFDLPRALQEMTNGTELTQALEAQGLIRSGVLSRELAETLTDQYASLLGDPDAEQTKGSMARALRALGDVEGKLGDLAGAQDDVFRVALVMAKLRDGMPLGRAIRAVQDTFYNPLSVTAPASEWAGLILPFAKVLWYTADQLPRLVAENPAKATALLAYVTTAYGVLSAASGVGSVEEANARDKLMPKGLNRGVVRGGTYLPLPVRDSYGQDLILSTRNWNPMNALEVTEGTALPGYPQALMPGGLPWILAQLLVNRDAFTEREITNPDDTAVDRTVGALGYAARSFGPSAIFDKGAMVANAALGRTDRFGRKMDLPTAGANLLGFKVQPVDLLRQRERTANDFQRRIREAQADERAAARGAGRAPDWAGAWAQDAEKARARRERAAAELEDFLRATAPAVAPGSRAQRTATQALPQGGNP